MRTGAVDMPHGDRLVVIVASAGGLAAFGQVLGALPAAFPAPVLVLQHLAPGGQTRELAQLLSWRTPLPVKVVNDGLALRSGQVYVAPSDRHTYIDRHRRLGLTEAPKVHHARRLADVLLCSAAASYGAGVIAVVLTGGRCDGVDGTAGVIAVHAAGGIVIVQDPATCVRPGMPTAAIGTGHADFVLPPTDIGLLLAWLTGPTDVDKRKDQIPYLRTAS